MTEKCAQIEQKCQRLISVAFTEVSQLNQKRVEPLKITHEATRDLVKDVMAPRVISNMTRIEALKNNYLNTGLALGVTSGGVPSVDIARLDNRMKALEQEVARSRQADGEAIAFLNLGFRSKKESDAWLVLNAPKDSFGCVLDFHTVMEHIHHQIAGIDSLSRLGK